MDFLSCEMTDQGDVTVDVTEKNKTGISETAFEYNTENNDCVNSGEFKEQEHPDMFLNIPPEQCTDNYRTEILMRSLSPVSKSPITTETDIDITAVLLPSGGTQSHPHAMRKVVTETQPPRCKGDVSSQIMKDKSHQYQPNGFPKPASGGKPIESSTKPFCFPTQPKFKEGMQFESFLEEKQERKMSISSCEIDKEECIQFLSETENMHHQSFSESPKTDFRYSDLHRSTLLGEMEKYQSAELSISKCEVENKTAMEMQENIHLDEESLKKKFESFTSFHDLKLIKVTQIDENPEEQSSENDSQISSDIKENYQLVQYKENSQAESINHELLEGRSELKMCDVTGQRDDLMETKVAKIEVCKGTSKNTPDLQQNAFTNVCSGTDGKCPLLQIKKVESFEKSRQSQPFYESAHNTSHTIDHEFNKSELCGESQVKVNPTEETTSCFFDTGQQGTVCFNDVDVENLCSDHDADEITLAIKQENKSCFTSDTNLHKICQNLEEEEELSEEEGTTRSGLQLESIEVKENSVSYFEDTEAHIQCSQSSLLSGITTGPSIQGEINYSEDQITLLENENIEGDNIMFQVDVKTPIQDVYGKLIKENGSSFLEELNRLFLDAGGDGLIRLDSGIVLTKQEKDIEQNVAIVTMRNGSKLGIAVPYSNLFLYYNLGIHFYITGKLNEDWFYTEDRITQERMLMKKVSVVSNWVKSLYNFLFLPPHPSLLVPYAVVYDRNDSIHFLMEDRHVLGVGRPPRDYCLDKQKSLWEVLTFLKYCKKYSLFPRDMDESILYTNEGICFDPSSLDNNEDSRSFKKCIKRAFTLLLCNEQQDHFGPVLELLVEHAYRNLEEDTDQLWPACYFLPCLAGPIPFSFPSNSNENEPAQNV